MNKVITHCASVPLAFRRLPASAFLVCLLAGCATATIEDAVPQGALTEETVTESAPQAGAGSGSPDNTGEFPNLNNVQRGEMAQMTPEEKRAYLARLRQARAEQAAAGGRSGRTATEAQMKKLAQTHDDETLKEIEADGGSADGKE